MDQVTKAKVQFRREQWKQLIIECQQSGLPVRTWCTQNGFREQTYYYYLKKIREEELSKLPVPVPVPLEETKPAVFERLEVQTPVPDTKAAAIVQQQFQLDPFSNTLFLFGGRNRNCMKALLWEGDGFVLLYKRLENGSFKWPKDKSEVKPMYILNCEYQLIEKPRNSAGLRNTKIN